MNHARHIARRAYRRVGADFGVKNVERVLLYGGIAIAAYLLFKAWNMGKAAVDVFNDSTNAIGSALGGGLYSLFHPGEADQITSTDYVTIFPDNLFHAVNSLSVSSSGLFTLPAYYGDQQFQMLALHTPTQYTAANGVTHLTVHVAQPV